MITKIHDANAFRSGKLEALEIETLKRVRNREQAFEINSQLSNTAAFAFLFLSGVCTGIGIMLISAA